MYDHHTVLIDFFEAIEYGIDTHKDEVIKTGGDLKSVKFLRYRNLTDCIYVRPTASRAPFYLLLDDISPDAAKAHRQKPGRLVCETSPGSFQAWIRFDQPLSYVQKRDLIAVAKADPEAHPTNDRWGRCPGFLNQKPKPKKLNSDGSRFWARLDVITKGNTSIANVVSLLSPPRSVFCSDGVGSGLLNVVASSSSFASGGSKSDRDESKAEYCFACDLIRKKIPYEVIVNKVAHHAQKRGKRRTYELSRDYAIKLVDGAIQSVRLSA